MRHLIITCLICCAGILPAAEPTAQDPMQAAMALVSTPTTQHADMAKYAGTWQVSSTMWMAAGAPPMTSNGSAVITSVLGGKWLRQEFTGEMMGQPYHGIGMEGYDTVAKQYVATWHDDFSTGQTTMTGTSSDGGKTVTYTSRMEHCPIHGGPLEHRYVWVSESPQRMTFTMYETAKGQAERKSMEMVYTR